MLDLTTERLMPLAEAARLVPPGRGGKKTHSATLVAWIRRGTRTADGRRVHLDALLMGGKWLTSVEALQRYAAAITPSPQEDATA